METFFNWETFYQVGIINFVNTIKNENKKKHKRKFYQIFYYIFLLFRFLCNFFTAQIRAQ